MFGAAGGGDHGVVLGEHHAELAERAVPAVAVPGHPELEAVALPPVRVRLVRVGHLAAGRLGDPVLVGSSCRSPHQPALQVELAELGDRLRGGVQSGEAEVAAGRMLCQPTGSMPSGSNSRGRGSRSGSGRTGRWTMARQRVGARLVVGEDRAGLLVRRDQQEAADRLVRVAADRLIDGLRGCPLAIAATWRTSIDRLRGSVMSASNSGK